METHEFGATPAPTVAGYARRIELLFDQKRYELALREGVAALALDPESAGIHRQLAYCLSALHRHADAIATAQRSIALGPDDAWNHRALAWCSMQDGLLIRAERAIEEAIRLDPGAAETWRLVALIAVRRKRWHESLEAAERGLACAPAAVPCALLRAQAFLNMGEYAAAADGLTAILALHPNQEEAHALLGLARNRTGDRAGAERHLREAVRLAPESGWIQRALRQVILEQHRGYRLLVAQTLRRTGRDRATGPARRRDRFRSPWLWLAAAAFVGLIVGSAFLPESTSGPIAVSAAVTYVLLLFVLPRLIKWRALRHLRRHEIGRYLDPPPDRPR